MDTQTIILAAAAIAGPVASIIIAMKMQARMQNQQNQWQEALARQLEKERTEWEMKREEARGGYEDAWKVANRDRFNEALDALKRIADALKK